MEKLANTSPDTHKSRLRSVLRVFCVLAFLFQHLTCRAEANSRQSPNEYSTTERAVSIPAKPLTLDPTLTLTHSQPYPITSLDQPVSQVNNWERHYTSGVEFYQKRIFQLSEQHLLAAEAIAKQSGPANAHLLSTYLALADLYLATELLDKAERLNKKNLPIVQKFWGACSKETSQALNGLAQCNYINGNYANAESLANQALAIRKKVFQNDSYEIGQTLRLLAKIADKFAWTDEAKQLYQESLKILEKHSGQQNLDLADLLQDMAHFSEAHGNTAEASALFERALVIRETAVRFDQSSALRGLISLPWDAGSPNCREIPDSLYPLKYQSANGIRVATTLVNIGRTYGAKTIAALVSIANTTDQHIEIGAGPVLLMVSRPTRKIIQPSEPDPIDRVYLERTFWALTWKRPVLAKLQITRASITNLKGEPSDLPDDYGGNVFGNYGSWLTGLTSLPDIFARERMHARGESILEPGVALVSGIRSLGLTPVAIGPHESRTGIIFFPAEHFDQAKLRVQIGNASFEFPFNFVEPW